MKKIDNAFGIDVLLDEGNVSIAQAVGLWPFYRIVVSRAFLALPREEQAALLAHEVGHCRSLHREKRLAMLPILLFGAAGKACFEWVQSKCQTQEIEADAFAAHHGLADSMLCYLSRQVNQRADFYPDIEYRAQALESHLKGVTLCKP